MNIQPISKGIKRFAMVIAGIAAAFMITGIAHAGVGEHIIETETGFYYTVQKGDTLWDLSQKFADSPWQWPDLWHYNPDIKNPHLIYPGQRIQVYKKSFGHDRPSPEAAEATKPEKKEQYFTYAKINATGFIREQAAEPAGTIFESTEHRFYISTDDKVYVEPASGKSLQIGDEYFIYRTEGPVRHPETNDYIGVQHLLTGVLKINEIHDKFAVGKVIVTFLEIKEGDQIMPFTFRDEKIQLKPGIDGLAADIIKSEMGWNIIGEDTVAFIDKGSDHGVEVGQQYKVNYRVVKEADRETPNPVELTLEEIGDLIVIHTEKQTATVLVTDSAEELKAGMLVQAAR